MSEADVEGSSESFNVPVLQRDHGYGREDMVVDAEETGRADRAGYWGLSLGTEYGILVFAKGFWENWWPARGMEALSLDDRGLFFLGFFASEPPLLFALELMVEKVESLLVRLW